MRIYNLYQFLYNNKKNYLWTLLRDYQYQLIGKAKAMTQILLLLIES